MQELDSTDASLRGPWCLRDAELIARLYERIGRLESAISMAISNLDANNDEATARALEAVLDNK